MSTHDDDIEFGLFEEPGTREAHPGPRRGRGVGSGGPRRPAPPPGAVALTRLAGLVALAVAVVVALVFWVGSCQGKSRHDEYQSYVTAVRAIAQNSANVGSDFAAELSAANLTLSGLETKLEQWSRLEQQEYAAAQKLRPPGPLQTAHQNVLAALQLRALGLAGLADTLLQAGSKSTTTVANELADQAQLLSASDIVWLQLFQSPATAALKAQSITGVIAPGSKFVSNPEDVTSRSFGIVMQRLKETTSGGTVTGLHGSALVSTKAVAGGKTVTLTTGTPTTIDVSASLVFQVVFQDTGNFPEVSIPVTISVIVSGETVYTKKKVVRQITAKQQLTVSFPNIQLPSSAFAHSASLHVAIGQVPGEKNIGNNQATFPVFFSLASGG